VTHASSCSSGRGGGLRAGSEDGGGFGVSSEHFSEGINIFLASADVWEGKVECFFEDTFLSHPVEGPPGGGNEVPGGSSTGDDSASKSVDTLHHVFGHTTG
jgi:hypothetical protein